MKTLIISDIHGSHHRLEDVLNTPLPYDNILLVGDLLYHGPRNPILDDYNPQKVADILNALDIPIVAVRGNCDAEVDQMLCKFPMMQDYSQILTDSLNIFITHGHLFDPVSEGPCIGRDLFISGHTHVPLMQMSGKTLLYNPGSISLPKENHPATYGYLDGRNLSTYTLMHETYMTHIFA